MFDSVGCVFDGTSGQVFNDVRLIRLAEAEGMEISADESRAIDAYAAGEGWFVAATTGARVAVADYFGHSADFACDALEFLNENSVADGFVLEWVDGDLVVSRVGMREWEAEEAYDDMLNECYPVVSLGGYDYDHARAFKSVDPIAYRCGMLDWLDSEGIELL
jgi:hypothetical protein